MPGWNPLHLVTRTFTPSLRQGVDAGHINTDWTFHDGGSTPENVSWLATDQFIRSVWDPAFSPLAWYPVYDTVDVYTAPTAVRLSADVRVRTPDYVGPLGYAHSTAIELHDSADRIQLSLTGGLAGEPHDGSAKGGQFTLIIVGVSTISCILPFQVKVYDGDPFAAQNYWYRIGIEKYGRTVRAYVDPTGRSNPYGLDTGLVNYLAVVNNLNITKTPLDDYNPAFFADADSLGAIDSCAFAKMECAELQYVESGGGVRPPGLPTEPINLPSGSPVSGAGYPTLAGPNVSMRTLAEDAAYHRYKSVRTAMAIYNHLRLDQ